MKTGKKTEDWPGIITNLTEFGSHYELRIESRSGFIVIIGKTNYGNFACIPDYNVGCHLCNFRLRDISYITFKKLNMFLEGDE